MEELNDGFRRIKIKQKDISKSRKGLNDFIIGKR